MSSYLCSPECVARVVGDIGRFLEQNGLYYGLTLQEMLAAAGHFAPGWRTNPVTGEPAGDNQALLAQPARSWLCGEMYNLNIRAVNYLTDDNTDEYGHEVDWLGTYQGGKSSSLKAAWTLLRGYLYQADTSGTCNEPLFLALQTLHRDMAVHILLNDQECRDASWSW